MKRVGSVELVTMSCRIPVGLHATATRYARTVDSSLAAVIVDALRAYLKDRQNGSVKNKSSVGG